MSGIKTAGNRMIQIENGVIGPREPRRKTLKVRTAADYPSVRKAYLDVAELYADTKMAGGIPVCDESIDLIQHMFTEDEASVMRHLTRGKTETAASIAAAEHRPVEEIKPLLDTLANEKRIIISMGKGDEKKYISIPLIPGVFEFVLARTSMDSLTDWHRRFCELFERLYETGYVIDQPRSSTAFIKYLPVSQVIKVNPMAYPSDKLGEILSRYSSFGVTLCQCRITEEVVGRGCDRPKEVCMAMGPIAEGSIRSGRMRRIDLKEALEIKAQADASGLVSWMDCQDPKIGGTSCSCCGCCCHLMRRMSEFNVPARVAPPHFIPKVDAEKCNYCGKCALACPMGAVTVDVINNTYVWDEKRCIGCAQCAVACSKTKAIEMTAVPDVDDFLQTMTRSLLS